MNTTIFNTPLLSKFLHHLARIILRMVGWQVVGGLPDLPKFILIGAPHTSNWDFVLFLGLAFYLQADVRFVGKAELFRGPLGAFFRYCGGFAVDRSKSNGLVEQMVRAIEENDHFILTITPEGTRHKVREWKRGFYHIAKSAGIPIVLGIVDGAGKAVRIGQIFYPTEDMEADMIAIQRFYAGMVGINPGFTSELNLET